MRLFVTCISASCFASPPKVDEVTFPSSYGGLYHKVGWNTLFKSVEENNGNAVISPLSIVGGMFMLAAATNGESQQEIFEAMDLENSEHPLEVYHTVTDGLETSEETTYSLKTANGVFIADSIDVPENFDNQLSRIFDGNLHSVDFTNDNIGSTETINQWVSDQTHNKISELYPEPLDSDTAMVLASSLYFKGNWMKKFEPSTNDDLCWFSDEQAMRDGHCLDDVEYMYSEDKLNYREFKREIGGVRSLYAKVVQIPFQPSKNDNIKNKLQFTVWYPAECEGCHILTNSEFDKEFQDFIRETAPTLQSNISRQQLSLTMPKFSIDFNADLIENLQQQGIETVFSREADFSPIVGDEMGGQISISAVDHAVKLDLDENGVEGAATTAIRGIFRSIQMRRTLEITRPFYFSITNKCQDLKKKGSWTCPFANVPLFVGKVVNPVKDA